MAGFSPGRGRGESPSSRWQDPDVAGIDRTHCEDEHRLIPSRQPSAGFAHPERMSFQKILLPTDLSPEGERAFAPTAELARKLRASIVLLHVIENVGSGPILAGRTAVPVLPGTAQEKELARAALAESRTRAFAGLEVQCESLVAPSVPHAIADYAVEHGCDAIALSTHGRTGFRRLVMGSVAEAVLRTARVPVLVFPRQK